MHNQIPKRIIQTGKQVEQSLPNRAMMSTVRLLNPDFDYQFFDDARVEAFVSGEFPQYRSLFDSFPYRIQRYDFFRYLAVYRHGGFYFDLDVILAEGLSPLLDCGCVFPFEGLTFSTFLRNQHKMDWQIGNYGFGAAPGHPFLEAIIANCERAQKEPAWVKPMMRGVPLLSKEEFIILNSTGPGLISRTLAENPKLAESVSVLFQDDVCDTSTWNRFGKLGIHFMEGSWRKERRFLRRRLALYLEDWRLQTLIKESRKMGKTRQQRSTSDTFPKPNGPLAKARTEPLVSILIPAYNAEEWIADSLGSALCQTWEPKEIIVVDDGSTDHTERVARQFEAQGVQVVTQKNQGAAAARNLALSLAKGEYIQYLDADDLLAPEKVERQMEVLKQSLSKRVLASGPWGKFLYRHYRAEFVPSALWCDLSPAEWLLRKMEQNVFMQTGTWLVSRELTDAAGPWDTRLLGDDDGEYFCRVLLASEGVKFVPGARLYFRAFGYGSLSYVGHSNARLRALWLSMQLHIKYLRSLDDSPRVRTACLRYLQTSLIYFYPEMTDIVQEAKELAKDLGGELQAPSLSWKYSWVKTLVGWEAAKRVTLRMRKIRWGVQTIWDRTRFVIEKHALPVDLK